MNLNSFGSTPLLPVSMPVGSAQGVNGANISPAGAPSINVYGGGSVGSSTVEAKIGAVGIMGLAILLGLLYFTTRGSNA